MGKKVVVLLSGGLDSTVSAYIARKKDKKDLYALTFNYGQEHLKEINCASEIAVLLEAKEHRILSISIPAPSSLTGTGDIPTEKEEEIPSTWVPQRNSIFLTLAFSYAEGVGADLIYTGFNIRDYSGYPDCRPEFVEAMQRALNLASKKFVETGRGTGIACPLMHKHKWEIVKIGTELEVPFEKTWSCYVGGEKACGKCDSCRIRREAFEKAGLVDPLEYEGERG